VKVLLDIDTQKSQMILRFSNHTIRFAISKLIRGVDKLISYDNGFLTFIPSFSDEEDYVDLREVCSWVDYEPDFDNLVLEVAK